MPTKESLKVIKYQRKQFALGLCIYGCKNPVSVGRHCLKHDQAVKALAKKNHASRRELRNILVKKGFCSNDCGRKLATTWKCRECADKINQYAKNWWQKNLIQNRIDKLRHSRKYRFGGLWQQVKDRDSNICQVCFKTRKRMVIHHINENPKDNRLENLICLCVICHLVVERMNANKPKLLTLFPWFNPNQI